MGVHAHCPAAEVVHPATSLNRDDARCRIIGHMQDAAPSPCCSHRYTGCMIWRQELERTRFLRRNPSGQLAVKTRKPRVAEELVGPTL